MKVFAIALLMSVPLGQADSEKDNKGKPSKEAGDDRDSQGAQTSKGPIGTIAGQVVARPSKYRENVLVYIDKISGKTFKPPKKHVVMDQMKLRFIPHVLPVLAGTTVDFKNSDEVLHNVFCPDACAKFNLGTYSKDVVKSYKFDKPGCGAVMLCKVHPEMEAWVVVTETPYFAVTDKKGKFTIKKVPPGTYTLKTWHKKKKPVKQEVIVKTDKVTEVELKLGRR